MLPLLSRRLAQRFFPHTNRLLTTYLFSTTSGSNPSRPSPPPIQVLLTESAGRGVLSIQPGELIHTAKPLVSHPSVSSIDKVCYFCLKNSVRRLGFQAPEVLFCSEECREQAKVWMCYMPTTCLMLCL
ncbi:putative [histone H3]-lysine(4) N-trimethyltransferase [Helianthus debilis subsp. tardiflorus]